ncbi:MAG: KamA family radical SAM protein [Candidatus Aureabacteria bacterium]|nr:KamA family radical SAM protein [Candidatus Auribacterota bacterium]
MKKDGAAKSTSSDGSSSYKVKKSRWYDWKWQLKNRITTVEEISKYVALTQEEKQGLDLKERLVFGVTPYFLSLIDPFSPNCPIRKQCVPTASEGVATEFDYEDPCAEEKDCPVPGLVHRYPDRVLLLATDECASYCRHCTRKRLAGSSKHVLTAKMMDKIVKYLSDNPKIRDVVVSGGDPLTLAEDKLEMILSSLKKIRSVQVIRIGTRVPIFLPMRIDEALVSMLKKYHPVWMSIHINHPREVTPDVEKALNMLADSGIVLGSQTVLLKGINDKPEIMKELFIRAMKNRVRPYYIYQCDPARGTAHFRTSVKTGVEIIENLRGFISGYAVPTYVIDAPGGGGKIPVSPNYVVEHKGKKWTLKNYRNNRYEYIEP